MLEETLACQLWSELGNLTDTAEDTTTPAPSYTVECQYADHATNATELCELWCNITAYQGGYCLGQNECPYVLMDPVLCSLWQEIQLG